MEAVQSRQKNPSIRETHDTAYCANSNKTSTHTTIHQNNSFWVKMSA
ncbi:hypothetical protein RSSM_01297 [Rhodopirellula sallentina SM41]|uniref:Uncharacterized protein n=1 Tax=Rhodopirellula sallentina SM41 TaxID=1263870 RepID=M5UHF2_9BACT|nr:hypothetical protein RSSM_01297 [Rhodopirellula sallentina SM41]